MKRLAALITLKLMALLMVPGIAHAMQTDYEQAVELVCAVNDYGEVKLDRAACGHYIKGFLDGAVLTDRAIIKEARDRSSFFERAYSTRVGADKKPLPVTYFAGFCIDRSMPQQQVVGAILAELEKQQAGGANDEHHAVYSVIKQLYPCDEG